jgi:uncharacterized protein VirK/YbjX
MIKIILNAARVIYPIKCPRSLYLYLRFFKHVAKHFQLLKAFIAEIESLGYASLFTHKIPVLGAVEWPYIHNHWDVKQRFDVIVEHYRLIKCLPKFLDVADGHPKKILDLNEFSRDTSVVLDKAEWFVREGEIVLNIFKEDLRVMSTAFTLNKLNGELVLYVGAIQGVPAFEESLLKIKVLTKDFEGLRPRDLLIEILRLLAKNIGATKILGIADEHRHHRHAYFSNYHDNTLKTSYNNIWLEQGGEAFGKDYFSLPLSKARKELSEVATNKRAMYRRRYEMMDSIQQRIHAMFQV